MINDYMGVINLNENESKIKELTGVRTLAAIPIGGRYRIIDFALSNLANAGIKNVGIFTKNRSRSVIDHVNIGKSWDLNRNEGGLFIFNFNTHDPSVEDIRMFRDNSDYLERSKQEHVIMTPSYMICNIDYKNLIEEYEKNGSDITIMYKNINTGTTTFNRCDTLNIDKSKNVLSVGLNNNMLDNINVCMEMFIMKKSTLLEIINVAVSTGAYKKIKEVIYSNLAKYNTKAFEYKGYLECVNSIESYFRINKGFIDKDIVNSLFYNKSRLIYTKAKYGAPTKYTKNAVVENSLIANGSIIDGTVRNSVISRSVIIEKDSIVEDCIINQNCRIMSGARLKNVIADKDSTITSGKSLIGDSKFPFVIQKQSII